MADEEDTREVLFPQWMGADKHGLTIEQKAQGEIFIKEVKEESPAAHTGRVFEGDQIVGATIYFENMSSAETADLLKTLNRHKVGLKLQHKTGDKSPCRSPMGTLSWEGRSGFGGSSPDIILSGDDEDYKRIYTKKIKPRLKSEDLAEGVDVRTERHSSTSSDGSTITTITRRITTYTVDMPGASGQQQIDISNPEFKIHVSQHEQQEGSSAQIRLPHGSLISKAGAQEGVDVGEVRLRDPEATSSSEKHWSTAHVKTTITKRGIEGSGKDLKLNLSDTGLSGEKTQGELGHSGWIQHEMSGISKGSVTGDTGTGNVGLSGKVGMVLDKDAGHVSISDQHLKESGKGFSISVNKGEIITPHLTEHRIVVSKPDTESEVKGSNVKGGTEFVSGFSMRVGSQDSKMSWEGTDTSPSGEIKLPKPSIDVKGFKVEGSVKPPKKETGDMDVSVPQIKGDIKVTELEIGGNKMPSITGPKISMQEVNLNIKGQKQTVSRTDVDIKGPKIKGDVDVSAAKVDIKDPKMNTDGMESKIKLPSFGFKGPKVEGSHVDISLPKAEVDIKGPAIDIKAPYADFDAKMPCPSGPKSSMTDVDINIKYPQIKDNAEVSLPKVAGDIKAPKVDIKSPNVDIEGHEEAAKMTKIKMPSFGLKGPKVEGTDIDVKLSKPELDMKGPTIDIKASNAEIEGPEGNVPKWRALKLM
ncbi:hypothetical protein MHYP_G00114250 [Metynnis hypsauchen]